MKRGSRKHDAEMEFPMSLMAWIDYSSIVFFFVVAGMLVVAIGRPRQRSKAMPGSDIEHAVHEKNTSYIALAVLCLFLVCLVLGGE